MYGNYSKKATKAMSEREFFSEILLDGSLKQGKCGSEVRVSASQCGIQPYCGFRIFVSSFVSLGAGIDAGNSSVFLIRFFRGDYEMLKAEMLRALVMLTFVTGFCLASDLQASVNINLIETGDDPVAELTGALVPPGSGLTIVGGSGAFVGSVGNGNAAQSATFTNLSLVPNNDPGMPTVSLNNGILLTSGTANLPMTNTNAEFNPFTPGTGSDADLTALSGSSTNDANSIQFDFTIAPGKNAVEFDFVFGSDEFPDQGITDVFGVFVDGVNYAFFPDGSLVSFVQGANASNFIDNDFGTDNYDFEYDGFSKVPPSGRTD